MWGNDPGESSHCGGQVSPICRKSYQLKLLPALGLPIARGLQGFTLLLPPASFTGPDFSTPGGRAVIGAPQRILPRVSYKSQQRKHPHGAQRENLKFIRTLPPPSQPSHDTSLADSLSKPLYMQMLLLIFHPPVGFQYNMYPDCVLTLF